MAEPRRHAHPPARGVRWYRRRILGAVAAAALVAGGAAVVTSVPASAGTSTLTAPRVVYTGVGQTIEFKGSDAISKQSRAISMDASIGACNPTKDNGWAITNCGRVQIGLTDGYGGTLFIAGTTEVADSPGVWKTSSGALIDGDNPTDPVLRGGPVLGIAMNGTLAQLNGALEKLEYRPAPGYEDFGANVPNIDILVNDGSIAKVDATAEIILRVEGENGGPTVAGPGTVLASAGVEAEYPPDPGPGDPQPQLVSVIDPELCKNDLQNICGGAYSTGNPPPESDDKLLLVAWIQEQNCGTFDLRSRSGFTNLGGATHPSVNALLTASTGLDLEQDAADAVLLTLGAAGAVDLAPQANALTTVFAGTASLDSVRYALSQITFKAPADDTFCNLNVAVSDLGNNGMPKEWKPGPDPADLLLGSYEIPNAQAAQSVVTFQVKDTSPDVEVDSALPVGEVAGPNKPAAFTVTFSEPVTGFDDLMADLDFSGSDAGTVTPTSIVPISATLYTVTAKGDDDGDIKLSIPAGAAQAAAAPNGDSEASPEPATIEWDQTKPTATILPAAGQADPTNDSPIVFTLEVSDLISTAPLDIVGSEIEITGSAGATTADVTLPDITKPKQLRVEVSGMTQSGDVTVRLQAGAFLDLALNPNEASATANVTYDVDGPDVNVARAPGQDPTTSDSQIEFEVTFSEDVTGFGDDPSDVAVGGSAGGDLANITGGPAVYLLTVTGMNQNGDVVVDIPAGIAEDALGNLNAKALTPASVDYEVPADPAPTVAVTPKSGQPNPVVGADVQFTVTFSEDVTDFDDPGDLDLGGTAVPASATISGSGALYTVTATGMSVAGTVTLGVKAGVAVDSAANPNEASIQDATVDWQPAPDLTKPTVLDIDRLQQNPTKTSPVQWTVEFSEPVTGFDLNDISTAGSTAPGTHVPAVSPAGPAALYTVSVSGMTGPGSVVIGFVAGAAVDLAGNPSEAPPNDPDASTTFDNQRPGVTVNQSLSQADPTSGSSIVFDVVFTEPVTGFTSGDLTITSSAGSLTALVQGSGNTYTVTLTGMLQTGTVSLAVVADAAQDAATNTSTASTSTDGIVQWNAPAQPDTTKPTVTIAKGASQADPTSAAAIVFDVVFSESVLGFETGDVQLSGSTLANSALVSGSGAAYTVTVTGMQQSGAVTVAVPADVAADGAANTNVAALAPATVQWTAPPQPDVTPPSVTVTKAAAQADPASGSSIVFDVVFSEPVVGFATGDVVPGGSTGASSAFVSGSGAAYTVTVTGMQQTGAVTISIAAGVASDGTNLNLASPQPASVQWNAPAQPDTTKPTVTVTKGGQQADPAPGGAVLFDVVFSEPVVGFTTGDVTLGGTADPGAASVSGGGATYTVTVTGMQQSGTVVVGVPAGVAVDGAGNANEASTDASVQWNEPPEPDLTTPTVTIDQAAGQADPTSTAPILFTVVFSEPVTGFATGDVTLSGTAGATAAVVTGAGTTYTVSVSGMTATGTVTVAIPAGVATDGTNTNVASTSTDPTVQWNAPANPDPDPNPNPNPDPNPNPNPNPDPNPNPGTGGSQTVATPGGGVTVSVPTGSTLQTVTSGAVQVPPPPGVSFPYGQLSFTATTTPGGLVTFTITLPGPVTAFYKLAGNAWLPFTFDGTTGAQVSGNTVTVTIQDNGRGDSNPALGAVTDPGAPAIVVTQLPGTGSDPAGPVGLAVVLVLAGLALLHVGRRRRATA